MLICNGGSDKGKHEIAFKQRDSFLSYTSRTRNGLPNANARTRFTNFSLLFLFDICDLHCVTAWERENERDEIHLSDQSATYIVFSFIIGNKVPIDIPYSLHQRNASLKVTTRLNERLQYLHCHLFLVHGIQQQWQHSFQARETRRWFVGRLLLHGVRCFNTNWISYDNFIKVHEKYFKINIKSDMEAHDMTTINETSV